MNRRDFLIGASMSSGLFLAGCSAEEDLKLPDPVQMNQDPWPVAAGMIGLATFSAQVLVLSRKDYPLNAKDILSAVSPVDLAVAWSWAAKAQAREAVELTQSDRRYNWRARSSDMKKPGVGTFTHYSGNWHMVPATTEVDSALKRVRKGDIISVEGDLVQVTFTNGIYFRSSMVRDDEGDGACEIIRARSVDVSRSLVL